MAPKKAAGKDKGGAPETGVTSLYQKREPLPPPESPNVEENEDAWRVARDAFLCPLPEWDAERVDTTEWNPTETETLYTNESLSAKWLPRFFNQHVSTWKRASLITDNTSGEEPAPEAKPPAPPVEKEPDADPKAKGKAKAAAGKGAKDVPAGGKPTTAQQFAEHTYTGETAVVTQIEFRNRTFELTNDEAGPPVAQAIASQMCVIGEHFRMMPKGFFLWELIYPQNEEGMPIYNPHGKYIVKLFVQGKWREVMVDDIMPVGVATGSTSLHAPIFPTTAAGNAIWPLILSKALLRIYNHDLKAPMLPAVQALTGMTYLEMPFTWQGLRSVSASRPFCCLSISSKVDLEGRQREALMMASADMDKKPPGKDARGGKPAPGVPNLPSLNLGASPGGMTMSNVPRLGANPTDALLQFVVCEMEDDPPQIRVKSATWRPMGGTPRKVVLDVADSDQEPDDQNAERHDADDRNSNASDDHDDDDDDRRSQRSPSGEATVPSARSKEEQGADGEQAEGEPEEPPGPVWPESYPPSLMPKSESMDYHELLEGGYWVGVEVLEEVVDNFVLYLQPGENSFTAQLDTTWTQDNREEAYTPTPLRLLRLQLTSSDAWDIDIEPTPRGEGDESPTGDDEEPPRERGPPWHKAAFLYEPVRLEPGVTSNPPMTGPGTICASTLLQQVNHWNPAATAAGAPEHISLAVTDTGGPFASRSVLLPTGEHWYLVQDDAAKAGSVLSALVDGALLSRSKSNIEFVDPVTFLPEQGVAMAPLGLTEYPAQHGFSVWAKAELNIQDLQACEYIQLLSHVSDPALRENLKVTLLRLDQDPCDEEARRCASWSVSNVATAPLQPLTSLTLRRQGMGSEAKREGSTVKFILMLEANVPKPVKPGAFSLNVMLLPKPGAPPIKPPAEGEQAALSIDDLVVDQITRWSAEVVPNERGLVLRERIVVPHGNGDMTATIRVSVTGLPKVILNAKLMAQMLPTSEMRLPVEDGATPEPFVPGAPVDPKEYRGRRNWLGSRIVVAEESSMERVTFAHTLLCEGSTYLLDVLVDPYKGPDKLEGGEWTIEIFGSAEVELGADTMEEDLEVLVRKSWEDQSLEPGMPPRSERASKTRKRWLKKRGDTRFDDEDLEEAAAVADPKAKAAPDPKAKAKAKAKGEAEAEPEVDKEQQEAEWLAAALQRAGEEKHSNVTVEDFVLVHTAVEPTVIQEDPYTIAPVLDEIVNPDCQDIVAIMGLGMKGAASVQQGELEETISKWEKIQEEAAAAKEANAQSLVNLTKWAEETAGIEAKYIELRESLREGLQQRYQAKEALKALVSDAEKLDTAQLEAALEEARTHEVSAWDAELVETGAEKKTFIEDFAALKDRLSKLEAEPIADEESKDALVKLSESVTKLQKIAKQKKLPLPPDMLEKELLQQAADAIAAAVTAVEGGEAAEGS